MNYVGVSITPRSGICSILLFTVFRCRRTVLPSSECLCTTVFECSGYVATTPVEGATDFVFTINKCSNWFGQRSYSYAKIFVSARSLRDLNEVTPPGGRRSRKQ